MAAILLLLWACAAQAQGWILEERKPWPSGTTPRGAIFSKSGVLAWGEGLPIAGSFAAGGCAGDVNGDGQLDLITQESGSMLWLEAPSWRRHPIDTDADFADCLWTSLGSRQGVLLIHRRIQLRFYWREDGRWESRDLYSIYTPSSQGGLLRGDVNGDGREDIYAGNYWLAAPENEENGWRLFAINAWWEAGHSAMLRLAIAGPGRIVAAQREANPARLAILERPPDPKQFWIDEPLGIDPPLRFVQGLAAWNGRVFAAENSGPGSRIVEFDGGRALTVGVTNGAFAIDASAERLTAAGPDALYRWRRATTGSGPAGRTKPVRDSTAARP